MPRIYGFDSYSPVFVSDGVCTVGLLFSYPVTPFLRGTLRSSLDEGSGVSRERDAELFIVQHLAACSTVLKRLRAIKFCQSVDKRYVGRG